MVAAMTKIGQGIVDQAVVQAASDDDLARMKSDAIFERDDASAHQATAYRRIEVAETLINRIGIEQNRRALERSKSVREASKNVVIERFANRLHEMSADDVSVLMTRISRFKAAIYECNDDVLRKGQPKRKSMDEAIRRATEIVDLLEGTPQ